ncbi:CLUMA_CG000742, isoform A [Clunio marinus]|uniref:CLUMA_CG000742, isoform A n=1 Tax=Clunio marinus TaxID=568069 RepID=A0A1J1HL08_9DIPT|nr:CLUMA_CG000742, isoform A [Clunio marinus]
MAWSKFQVFLAILLVVTGSLNTLTTKWADKISSVGKDGGEPRTFDHPFVQACFMFFGEFMCLIVFKAIFYQLRKRNDGSEDVTTLTKGNRNFNQLILWPAAMLDMIATSTMYIGLNLTYASSFQMLRGSVIVFVAIFSMIFLQRRLQLREWMGIGFIIIGLTCVGLSDMLGGNNSDVDRLDVLIGDSLIILAQIITASQMVFEERFVAGLDIPALQAVGWEGFFGFSVLSLLLIPMYFISVPSKFTNNPRGVMEDAIDAFYMIKNNHLLMVPISGTIISIAFFNFAGISVTKEISATTRMVLDSIRTMVIWAVSLLIGWQSFHYLQVVGFISLLFGMCVYNNIIVMNPIRAIARKVCRCGADPELQEPIINQQADA